MILPVLPQMLKLGMSLTALLISSTNKVGNFLSQNITDGNNAVMVVFCFIGAMKRQVCSFCSWGVKGVKGTTTSVNRQFQATIVYFSPGNHSCSGMTFHPSDGSRNWLSGLSSLSSFTCLPLAFLLPLSVIETSQPYSLTSEAKFIFPHTSKSYGASSGSHSESCTIILGNV